MSDLQPVLATAPATATPKAPLISKMSGSVTAHPQIALAIIVVLVIVVIGMYIYYHGALSVGPFSTPSDKSKSNAKSSSDNDPESDYVSDPETEQLINSINSKA